ncbi:xanthine/uracil permease family protein [gut metagenome]|uniref:Xanthine/uracil permease family protein n=1 Tax=gut metagenome TaxID=749906 RepID=J9GCJ8_9ZZZZ
MKSALKRATTIFPCLFLRHGRGNLLLLHLLFTLRVPRRPLFVHWGHAAEFPKRPLRRREIGMAEIKLDEESVSTGPRAGSDLIYKLDDRPPLKDSLFAALQHLLAIFVAIVTPPLIIAGALKLDIETTSYLVSMSLFVSGIATFIQCRTLGPIGCGLLCIQGTSFSFIGPIIAAGLTGGLSSIFGATIAASCVEMVVSRCCDTRVALSRRWFPVLS